MTRSQDEIKRLADQLDDNEVRLKLQTEIIRLFNKIVLNMKIQKIIIYYHKPKLVVRFKSGKSQLFIETDGEQIDNLFRNRNTASSSILAHQGQVRVLPPIMNEI
jgi:hypothetical protein